MATEYQTAQEVDPALNTGFHNPLNNEPLVETSADLSISDTEVLTNILQSPTESDHDSLIYRIKNRISESRHKKNFHEIIVAASEDLRSTPKGYLVVLGATAIGFAGYIPGQEYILGTLGSHILRDSNANPLSVGEWVGGAAFSIESFVSTSLVMSLKRFPRATEAWQSRYFKRPMGEPLVEQASQTKRSMGALKERIAKNRRNFAVAIGGGSPSVVLRESLVEHATPKKQLKEGFINSAELGAMDFGIGALVAYLVRHSNILGHEASTIAINGLDHSETWVGLALLLAYGRHRKAKAENIEATETEEVSNQGVVIEDLPKTLVVEGDVGI